MNEAPPPQADKSSFRISHFLSRAGVASRRKAEDIVRKGRVRLNGNLVEDLATQVIPGADEVTVDDKQIHLSGETLVLAMNKPKGIVVTRHDPQHRRTVYDLLPKEFSRQAGALAYAGRLDASTTGLLILSTDGDLLNRLMHPRYGVRKTYHCSVDAPLSEEDLKSLRGGIALEEFQAAPCEVRELTRGGAKSFQYELALHEGKNREVRRMMRALGKRINWLRRVAVGGLDVRRLRLREGEVRALGPEEVAALCGPAKP